MLPTGWVPDLEETVKTIRASLAPCLHAMPALPLVPDGLLDAVALRFRLLGDPTRLRLLRALFDADERTVQETADATGQSHANTSKHLRLLAEAGVVGARRDGLHVHYRITDPTLRQVCALVCGQLGGDAPPGA